MRVSTSVATIKINVTSEKAKSKLPNDPCTLLVIHPKDYLSYNINIFTSIFVVALFTKTRK